MFLPRLFVSAQQDVTALVQKTLGTDQQLVNGIQFSNQYARIDGQPYFLDGDFHTGTLKIKDQWVTDVQLRYNLYSQRVEIEYTNRQGHRNQIMTIPESVPAFFLNGFHFSRVEFPDREPAYYQVVSWNGDTAFVGWSRRVFSSQNNSSKPSEFSAPERIYWIEVNGEWKSFDNRKSYLRTFSKEQKRAYAQIIQDHNYSFQKATAIEIEQLLKSVITLNKEHP